MTDDDLIQEARLTSLPTPLSLTRELAKRLEAANARADHLGATLAAMEAGMEARPDSCLRQDELAARHGQRAVIEHVRAALARVPAEPATEEKPEGAGEHWPFASRDPMGRFEDD